MKILNTKICQNFILLVIYSYFLPMKNLQVIQFLEALSHGCPVICSSQCGTKSYIKHNVNGYIFKNNSKSDLIKYIHEITNRDKYINLKKYI